MPAGDLTGSGLPWVLVWVGASGWGFWGLWPGRPEPPCSGFVQPGDPLAWRWGLVAWLRIGQASRVF